MPAAPPAARPPGALTKVYLVNTLANAALKGVSVLAGLWAARELVSLLGAAGFGLVTLSGAVAGYASFLGLGLPAGLVRQVADYRGHGMEARLPRLLRLAALLFAGVGLAGALLLAAFALGGGVRLLALPAGGEAAARNVLLATAAVVLVSWPLSVFPAILTGMQRYPALNTVTGLALVASAALSVVVARSGLGAAAVVLATGAVMAAGGIVQALLVRRELRGVSDSRPGAGVSSSEPPASTSERAASSLVGAAVSTEHAAGPGGEVRSLLSFGVWVLALEVASLLIYQTDQILLGVFLSVESLTGYYVAARLHNMIREGNGVLTSALFPLIAEERGRGNPAAVEQAIYRGSRYGAAVVAPATLAAILLARPFIRVWMGPDFEHLAPVAQAFASYWLAAVLVSVTGQVALGLGESALIGKIALATAVVNVAVSLALVRPWGIAGVVTGTLVAYALGIPAHVALVFPRIGVDRGRFWREVVRPVYGVVIPAAIAWWGALALLPEPRGIGGLLLAGAGVLGTCWAALWFLAVDAADRRRVSGWMAAAAGRTA